MTYISNAQPLTQDPEWVLMEYVIISAIMIIFTAIMYILQKLVRLSRCYNQVKEDLSIIPTLIEMADMRLRQTFHITPSQEINPENIEEEEEEIEMPTRYYPTYTT